MNRISEALTKGTFGELLVQLRLLQYGVQAAPPLKDSGNDLIAVLGDAFRAIQVKTTAAQDMVEVRNLPERFHVLALVVLAPDGSGVDVSLDRSRVFLIPREEAKRMSYRLSELAEHEISPRVIKRLFGTSHEQSGLTTE